MFLSDGSLCFLGDRCVTSLTPQLWMWEMCQRPAERWDWLVGHTPPPSSSSHYLQTWSAQTLWRGRHRNYHFRRVASCKHPLFSSIPPPLYSCFGVFALIPLFPFFFWLFVFYSFFQRDLSHSISVSVSSFLGLIHFS